jgi:cyclopropane fatty-acyl-phospholipid synthase-like methyltransferase
MFPVWDELYRTGAVESLPWYWPAIDPDLDSALVQHGIKSGRVLDLGTGPGTQALALAERGFDVTASDLSAAAIAYVERQATARGVRVNVVVDDILATKLKGPFDVIFDRGCFHVLPPERRDEYARTVLGLLSPSGWLFLKTFSHLQAGEQGPYRFKPEDIRRYFGPRVKDIRDTVYHGTLDPFPKALFSSILG